MAPWTASPETNALSDEFSWIARLRPLTRNDSRALDLMDDAAIIPGRIGYDLVITKDAMVEGVHFLNGEAPEVIARRLLRTNLSDLAAKAAEPFGYFLMTAWSAGCDGEFRERFASGLAEDGDTFGLALLGGDTISTPGPFTVSATMMGWSPEGRVVRRSGARATDRLVVCGTIGDGWLGLKAALGEALSFGSDLANHYRLPTPLLSLRDTLRGYASATADVSDGLLADAGHIARASGLGIRIDLDHLPLSDGGRAWLDREPDRLAALRSLAIGGDDYALACAVSAKDEATFLDSVASAGVRVATVGEFVAQPGLTVHAGGAMIEISQLGWRH